LNLVSGEVEDVRLLGSSAKLEWKQTEAALKVELAGVPTENNGYALEVVLKSD
jgi:DNA mismatch repair protein MutH